MRVAVAGGAGHLGSAICAGLVSDGHEVLCLSSRPSNVDGVTSAICDVCDEAELEKHLSAFGKIDGFVNCAGRAPRHADMKMSGEEYAAALNSSAGAAFRCIKTASRHMPGGGSIVTLASMWGLMSPTPSVYLGMKNDPSFAGVSGAGAVLALVRHMAVTLAPLGIRVNALVPGWFPKKRGPDNPEYMAEIKRRVPMGRIGAPSEIVGPAIFLLSKASSYMTGQHLVIDGGYSIQ
jgi:NAD(P)-dependent dehydrogenase (short-subunit alcohol dehydrogenase family)